MINIDITLVFQIINFLLMIFILTKLLYKPFLNVLEKRKNYISDSLAAADKDKAEANKLLAEYKAQLAEATSEASKIIQESQQAAEKMKKEIEVAAQERADSILDKAEKTIAREKDQAFAELKKEVLNLAVEAASVVLKKELDAQAHRQLIDEFLKKAGRVS